MTSEVKGKLRESVVAKLLSEKNMISTILSGIHSTPSSSTVISPTFTHVTDKIPSSIFTPRTSKKPVMSITGSAPPSQCDHTKCVEENESQQSDNRTSRYSDPNIAAIQNDILEVRTVN